MHSAFQWELSSLRKRNEKFIWVVLNCAGDEPETEFWIINVGELLTQMYVD